MVRRETTAVLIVIICMIEHVYSFQASKLLSRPSTLLSRPRRNSGARFRTLALYSRAPQGEGLSPESDKDSIFEEARKARDAAEEAAERAAALRLGGSSTGNRTAAEVKSTASKARSAAEALKSLAAPGTSSSVGASQSDANKVKFTRKFFEAEINKPLGMVLEENHPSIKGCVVSKVMPGSNSDAYQQKSVAESEPPLVGAQVVFVNGKEVLGMTLEEVMNAIRDATAPVQLRLYHGSASSLYGGWEQEAKGAEVTINTGLPNKALIDRMRSGL